MKVLFRKIAPCLLLLITSLAFVVPSIAQAHPLDVAYLDFGLTGSQLTLTVAIHPYQAYELVRGASKQRFDLKALQQHGELVSAYVEDRVQVTRGGASCDWQAQPAQTPATELEAVGDGVTIAGNLVCQNGSMSVTGASTLFLEGYPSQTSILRLDLPEGYAERMTLDHATRQGTIDVTQLFQEATSTPSTSSSLTSAQKPRRPDAPEANLAQRFLDPGLSPWGVVALLLLAIGIGALHALGPGHGKSLLAAMLVGERATVRHMLTLGTVMTVTHVADVFILSIVASFIAVILPPAALLGILEIISAVSLVGFGLYGLVQAITRYRLVRHNAEFVLADEAHARAHALGMPHAHGASESRPQEDHSEKNAWRRILWMGFVGSLAPCPTAWAIFLGTISAGRPGAGFILLVAFSLGLYGTILTIGILLLKSRAFAAKHTPPRITYAMPIFSATLITLLGAVFLIRLIIT